jgi:hypothetical protein
MLLVVRGASGQDRPAPPPAPSSQDATTDQARALFNEGTDKAHHGEWALALTAFERSSALHPHAVTTYNIGYCERALGRYMRARKMLGEALAENAAHGGVELPDDLAAGARSYLAETEQQIARAVVSVSPEGASITIDGRPLERAVTDGAHPIAWAGTRALGPAEPVPASTFELHLDPGPHVFVVSKVGFAYEVSTRTFEPGSEQNLVITLSPSAPTAVTASVSVGRADAAARRAAPSRIPLVVALGVGAAGLATGAVAGAVAIGIKDEGRSHYPQAGTAADVATVGFVVGGVGAAVGVLYWWLSMAAASPSPQPTAPGAGFRGPRTRARLGVRAVPWATPWGGGVDGTF